MESLHERIEEVCKGVRRVLQQEMDSASRIGEAYLSRQHLLVFIGLEVLSLNRNVQSLEARITAMSETQQQQHDAIMAALGTVNTNLVTFNKTAQDLSDEVAALKAANPTVDFTDAETLATGLVAQSGKMITDFPDPGAQTTGGASTGDGSTGTAPAQSDPAAGTAAPNPS